jgi:hypothetical protein
MYDYTFHALRELLQTLKSQGFLFSTLSEYERIYTAGSCHIILRHDVEAHYNHALQFAQIQHSLGIKVIIPMKLGQRFRTKLGHF